MPPISFVNHLFLRPLLDLGDFQAELQGIYSPSYDLEEINRYMSSYYASQSGAEAQAEKIDLTGYYHCLLEEALDRLRWVERTAPVVVLDVGCGFGSTTLPLLRLFPNAFVIASELSAPMLLVLKRKLAHEAGAERCWLMQLNAETLDFQPGAIDLIVGAAILHHLFDPEKLFASCARILRPGGAAVFFEPFEAGYSILSLVYREILAQNGRHGRRLTESETKYFEFSRYYWQKMKNPDKTDAFFMGADDKWLFTKAYLNRLATGHGYTSCQIYPLEKSNRPFEVLARTHLVGNGIHNPPNWIWDILQDYENSFSDELKQDLLTEGCILLRK